MEKNYPSSYKYGDGRLTAYRIGGGDRYSLYNRLDCICPDLSLVDLSPRNAIKKLNERKEIIMALRDRIKKETETAKNNIITKATITAEKLAAVELLTKKIDKMDRAIMTLSDIIKDNSAIVIDCKKKVDECADLAAISGNSLQSLIKIQQQSNVLLEALYTRLQEINFNRIPSPNTVPSVAPSSNTTATAPTFEDFLSALDAAGQAASKWNKDFWAEMLEFFDGDYSSIAADKNNPKSFRAFWGSLPKAERPCAPLQLSAQAEILDTLFNVNGTAIKQTETPKKKDWFGHLGINSDDKELIIEVIRSDGLDNGIKHDIAEQIQMDFSEIPKGFWGFLEKTYVK